MKDTTPLEKPGTQEAIEAGCSCPVLDNNNGKGVPNGDGEPLFWYSSTCEYHKVEETL